MKTNLYRPSGSQINHFLLVPLLIVASCQIQHKGADDHINIKETEHYLSYSRGAVIRTDTTKRTISIVFTAHEFAEGYEIIHRVLTNHQFKASFFFTGDFYRNPSFSGLVNELKEEGHYLGAHSDRHLLYASWENRDSLLITKEEFTRDIQSNYREMEKFGIVMDSARIFLPPFEWYNDSISSWCEEMGITLVNFSPGTISNHDWTFPGPGNLYFSSDSIYNNILAFETQFHLNGFILLLHLGTDPQRTDKFYYLLNDLLRELEQRGYRFTRLNDVI